LIFLAICLVFGCRTIAGNEPYRGEETLRGTPFWEAFNAELRAL
jgi:hypothetical protein